VSDIQGGHGPDEGRIASGIERANTKAEPCDTPGGLDMPLNVADSVHAQAVITACIDDLQAVAHLGPGDLLVIGASSSEVMGKRIGTATSLEVGRWIVDAVLAARARHGFDVAFQCCEHLNRALVVEKTLAQARNWRIVQAIPVPGAGGAVTSVAYFALADACLVETVAAEADAGIDIGDTFIGMHLKRVAVPVRGRHQTLGMAHVTMARSRPPLVGGERAVYDLAVAKQRLGIQL